MARWTGYLLSRPSRIRPSYSPSGNRGSRNMTWPRCFPGPRPRFLAFFPSAVYVQDSAPRGAKEQAPFPGSEFPASRATTPPVQRPWAPKSRSHEGAVRRRKLAQMPSRPPRLAGLVADPPGSLNHALHVAVGGGREVSAVIGPCGVPARAGLLLLLRLWPKAATCRVTRRHRREILRGLEVGVTLPFFSFKGLGAVGDGTQLLARCKQFC
ncbi:hypothetical protein VUR80DRAFT_1579 [Thermomyces stellatus]